MRPNCFCSTKRSTISRPTTRGKAELVQHRFFAGLTIEQAAEVIDISVRTAHRDWLYARAGLGKKIDRLRPGARAPS